MKKTKLAFTLVELIIVITIIAILSTIGFLNFGDYIYKTKDNVKIIDLKNIEKVLTLHKIKKGDYPEPDVDSDGNKIFGENTLKETGNLNTLPKDPETKKEYFYNKFGNGFVLKAKDNSGENKFFIIKGGELNFSSCKEILENNLNSFSGEYKIYPNGQEINVYCDMDTTDENGERGWTRYLNIKGNYTFDEAKNCWLGNIISNENIDCFNPNRFGIKAETILTKYEGKNIFYKNNQPEPTTTHREEKKDASRPNNCLGGYNYMTILNYGSNKPVNDDASDIHFVWLGTTYCKYRWQIGGISKWNKYFSENFENIKLTKDDF